MINKNVKLLMALIAIILLVVLVSLIPSRPNTRERTGTDEENDKSGFLADFLPFGKKKQAPSEEQKPANISDFDPEEGVEVKAMTLTRVSSMPIAGFGVFQKERFVELPPALPLSPPALPVEPPTTEVIPTAPPTEFVATLRYVEKATGNIYQTFADVINERRFSETTVLGVHDAYFADQGRAVIMRYLKTDGATIASFAGSTPNDALGSDYIRNELRGSFLPENIIDLSVAPDSGRIFYLSKAGSGIVGVTASPLGQGKEQIFDSAFTEWTSSWPSAENITLTTKPSGQVPGYMYEIDPTTKEFRKVLDKVFGLTVLPGPDGRKVLFGNNNMELFILDKLTGDIKNLNIKTLPEKCVWESSSDGLYCLVPNFIGQGLVYPDVWYQGEISFSDQVWRVDALNAFAQVILDPTLTLLGPNIDGVKPALSENQNYLFFINKKDSYLWELKLR